LTPMTRPPLLRVVGIYVKEYAVAVISASLIYGGIHQIMSVVLTLIYPIANIIPHLVDAMVHSRFDHIPPLASYYGDSRMWASLTKVVAIGIIVIVVGILAGLWANSRSRHVPASAS